MFLPAARRADASRAEELTQDVFLALLQGAGRYEARGPFRAYLFGITFNVLMAERRRAGHRASEPRSGSGPPCSSGEG